MKFQKGHKTNLGKHWKQDKPFSKEHKKKIGLANSISHKGLKQSEEHIKKIVKSRHDAFLKRQELTEENYIYWNRYRQYKLAAKKMGRRFDLTLEQFKLFWQKPCYYCGETPTTIGLDRVDNSKDYEINNIVSCCFICNYMKNQFPQNIFIEHCRKVNNNMNLK